MSVTGSPGRALARGQGSVVICDGNGFNLRFLRAAMMKLGFAKVLEAKTLDELEDKARVVEPELIVFDPAMQDGAGVDAMKTLREISPESVLVAFCSDDTIGRTMGWLGVTVVPKHSIMHLDVLVSAIEGALGLAAIEEPEAIPTTDMATPVWDLVPSLVED